MRPRLFVLFSFLFFAIGWMPCGQLKAQNLTLEGQTGGFLTPTAYVVYADKGQTFSHPAVGFHFIDAKTVIGNIETFSVTEGFRTAQKPATRAVFISLETSPPQRPRRWV